MGQQDFDYSFGLVKFVSVVDVNTTGGLVDGILSDGDGEIVLEDRCFLYHSRVGVSTLQWSFCVKLIDIPWLLPAAACI